MPSSGRCRRGRTLLRQINHVSARMMKQPGLGQLSPDRLIRTFHQQLKHFPRVPRRLSIGSSVGLAVLTPFRQRHDVCLIFLGPLNHHAISRPIHYSPALPDHAIPRFLPDSLPAASAPPRRIPSAAREILPCRIHSRSDSPHPPAKSPGCGNKTTGPPRSCSSTPHAPPCCWYCERRCTGTYAPRIYPPAAANRTACNSGFASPPSKPSPARDRCSVQT